MLFFWVAFENVMSLHRTKATLIGLLEAGRANEWVVTAKLGSAMKMKSANKAGLKKQFMRIWERYGVITSTIFPVFFYVLQLMFSNKIQVAHYGAWCGNLPLLLRMV